MPPGAERSGIGGHSLSQSDYGIMKRYKSLGGGNSMDSYHTINEVLVKLFNEIMDMLTLLGGDERQC